MKRARDGQSVDRVVHTRQLAIIFADVEVSQLLARMTNGVCQAVFFNIYVIGIQQDFDSAAVHLFTEFNGFSARCHDVGFVSVQDLQRDGNAHTFGNFPQLAQAGCTAFPGGGFIRRDEIARPVRVNSTNKGVGLQNRHFLQYLRVIADALLTDFRCRVSVCSPVLHCCLSWPASWLFSHCFRRSLLFCSFSSGA